MAGIILIFAFLLALLTILLVLVISEEGWNVWPGILIFLLSLVTVLLLAFGIVMYKDGSCCDKWNCNACGTANSHQTSCCAQCGTKKSGTGRWQCVCEQWNTGNYCTACGKAKDCCSSSWTCDCGTQNDTEYCCACGKKH